MTENQKSKIRRMRLDGMGYRAIANALELSVYTVKSYCKRNHLAGVGAVVALNNVELIKQGVICKQCGAKLNHTNGKRRKVFCSDNCRKKYWKLKNEV